MVDNDFGPTVAKAVNKIGSNVSAKTSIDIGLAHDAKDKELVAHDQNWIILTHDKNTLNERFYKPCKHDGIIIIKEKRWFPETVVASLKALRRSGKANLVPHHVTHLFPDKAIIHTHKGIEEIKL
jgi:hypothetical protein